ncbi:hypothetical protein ACHAWF_007339, partial [Thalassiosira exigua]
REAILAYHAAVPHFERAGDASDELTKVWANVSECYLRINNADADAAEGGTASLEDRDARYEAAIGAADRSLAHDPTNVKAAHRKARAKLESGELRGAIDDGDASGAREGEVLATEARSKLRLYGSIVDSYRLRVEETYVRTGDADAASLYGGEVAVPARHFRGYLRLGLSRRSFPSGFAEEDLYPIGKFAEKDEWHCIKYAVELGDVKEHYGKLGRPMEHVKLREIAFKAMGPINPYPVYGGDEVEIRDYMSLSEGDESEVEGETDISWMYDEPFSPYGPNANGYDPQFTQQSVEFCARYGLKEYPIDRLRLDVDAALLDEDCNGVPCADFVRSILRGKFGKGSNKMKPEKFATRLRAMTIAPAELLREMVPDKLEDVESEEISGPMDWRFDHYGTVCSLVLVAFKMLP